MFSQLTAKNMTWWLEIDLFYLKKKQNQISFASIISIFFEKDMYDSLINHKKKIKMAKRTKNNHNP